MDVYMAVHMQTGVRGSKLLPEQQKENLPYNHRNGGMGGFLYFYERLEDY